MDNDLFPMRYFHAESKCITIGLLSVAAKYPDEKCNLFF